MDGAGDSAGCARGVITLAGVWVSGSWVGGLIRCAGVAMVRWMLNGGGCR